MASKKTWQDIRSDLTYELDQLDRHCTELEEENGELRAEVENVRVDIEFWRKRCEELEDELSKTGRILAWEIRKANLRST